MFKDVKKKLTLLYTFSLLFLLMLFITVLYYFISHEIEHKEQKELRQFLDNEKHEITEDYYDDDEHSELEFDPNKKIFFYIYSESNQFLLGVETLRGLSKKVELLNKDQKNINSEIITDTWNDTHFMMIKEPIPVGRQEYGTIYVGMNITNEKHFIQTITWILFLLTIIFSLLFGLLGYYFAGLAMKPIGKAFESQRKFVSDASHELRTPLSIFYSSIDLLMREKESLSAFGQEVLQDMKSESEMMNKLISDLLLLARSDNSNLKIEKKEINLSLLVQSLSRRILSSVPKTIDFVVEIEDDIIFHGDDFRIQQLIYILIDNAFRYTRQGIVKLSLKKQSDLITLTIEDSGAGINKTDLPHIFDRFYRGDKSRVRDGSGLGLSIAKSIVTAHDGKISVKSEPGVGTIFTVGFK